MHARACRGRETDFRTSATTPWHRSGACIAAAGWPWRVRGMGAGDCVGVCTRGGIGGRRPHRGAALPPTHSWWRACSRVTARVAAAAPRPPLVPRGMRVCTGVSREEGGERVESVRGVLARVASPTATVAWRRCRHPAATAAGVPRDSACGGTGGQLLVRGTPLAVEMPVVGDMAAASVVPVNTSPTAGQPTCA